MQRVLVGLAIIERIEHLAEYVVGRDGIEERHARANLQGIDATKNRHCILTAVHQQRSGDFSQPGTKNGMAKICLRFVEPAYAIVLGIGAAPQHCQLREDKPYLVGAFAPEDDFLQGDVVV